MAPKCPRALAFDEEGKEATERVSFLKSNLVDGLGSLRRFADRVCTCFFVLCMIVYMCDTRTAACVCVCVVCFGERRTAIAMRKKLFISAGSDRQSDDPKHQLLEPMRWRVLLHLQNRNTYPCAL